MRGLSNRLKRLEARHGPGAILSAMSDEDLQAALENVRGQLTAMASGPPSGWDAPLGDLIRWLEGELEGTLQ